jgi:hypothetical protein
MLRLQIEIEKPLSIVEWWMEDLHEIKLAKEDSKFQSRDQTVRTAENAALEYVLILPKL